MTALDLYIDGKHVPAEGGRRFARANPVTGEVATEAAAASLADAEAAVAAAARAFPAWAATGPKARREALMQAAANLSARADDIVRAMKEEIGATEAWARFNVMLAADMLVEAGALTTQMKGEIVPSNRPGSTAMAMRQPAGVVLAMAPWNAPVILGVRAVATPLACGNTVVMKTSELCPRTHALIVEAIADRAFIADFPMVRTPAEYQARLDLGWNRLTGATDAAVTLIDRILEYSDMFDCGS